MCRLLGPTLCLAACATPPRGVEDLAAARWEVLDSGATASLRGLSPVDDRVCWVSGGGGTVLRTVDGGRSWQARGVPGAGELDFRDVQAFDSEVALVLTAGQPARIYSTADGGATWSLQHESGYAEAFFDSFAFFDRERGIAFSDPVDGRFLVLRTGDGGRSWSEVAEENLPEAVVGEAGFAASGTCVAVVSADSAWIGTGGATARVLRSSDSGLRWSAHVVPVLAGAPSQGVFSVAFADTRHGVVVGGDYRDPERAEGTAAWTEDGGITWHAAVVPPGGYRSCVAAVPGIAGAWLAVGLSGSDWSPDGGRSWRPLSDPIGDWHALAFAGDGSSWAVGANGRIARLRW